MVVVLVGKSWCERAPTPGRMGAGVMAGSAAAAAGLAAAREMPLPAAERAERRVEVRIV